MSWLFMLLALFGKYLNKGWRFQKAISESTYPAYFIHLFFVFGIVALTRMIPFASVIRLAINIILVTLLSFIAGYGLKKIPGLKKVL
jgi:hypothetical protein